MLSLQVLLPTQGTCSYNLGADGTPYSAWHPEVDSSDVMPAILRR